MNFNMNVDLFALLVVISQLVVGIVILQWFASSEYGVGLNLNVAIACYTGIICSTGISKIFKINK